MRVGDLLSGRFRLEAELTRSTYRAHDIHLDRRVLVKAMPPTEAAAMRTTQIERVYEVVTEAEEPYVVLEWPRRRSKRRAAFFYGLGSAGVVGIGVATAFVMTRTEPQPHRLVESHVPMAAPAPAPAPEPVVAEPDAPAKAAAIATTNRRYATFASFEDKSSNIQEKAARDWLADNRFNVATCVEKGRCIDGTNVSFGVPTYVHIVNPKHCERPDALRTCLADAIVKDQSRWPLMACKSGYERCASFIEVRLH